MNWLRVIPETEKCKYLVFTSFINIHIFQLRNKLFESLLNIDGKNLNFELTLILKNP